MTFTLPRRHIAPQVPDVPIRLCRGPVRCFRQAFENVLVGDVERRMPTPTAREAGAERERPVSGTRCGRSHAVATAHLQHRASGFGRDTACLDLGYSARRPCGSGGPWVPRDTPPRLDRTSQGSAPIEAPAMRCPMPWYLSSLDVAQEVLRHDGPSTLLRRFCDVASTASRSRCSAALVAGSASTCACSASVLSLNVGSFNTRSTASPTALERGGSCEDLLRRPTSRHVLSPPSCPRWSLRQPSEPRQRWPAAQSQSLRSRP